MRAIETTYRGCRFRSRLEARWAVALDAAEIAWAYELEGFVLADGRHYLPDFYLSEVNAFVEIKPTAPRRSELELARLLAEGSGRNVYLFGGEIPWFDRYGRLEPRTWAVLVDRVGRLTEDEDHWLTRCPGCQKLGLEFEGRWGRIACGCRDKSERASSHDERIIAGYYSGRMARFEHGEQPVLYRPGTFDYPQVFDPGAPGLVRVVSGGDR